MPFAGHWKCRLKNLSLIHIYVTAKADFVSDYIWRGAYQNSGFSVQPTLGLSYGNLSCLLGGVRA